MSEVFTVDGPLWLEGQESCESCGHYSSFEAGFEIEGGEYVRGWYNDTISCYDWDWYDPEKDTVEAFREFLGGERREEAEELLEILNREVN